MRRAALVGLALAALTLMSCSKKDEVVAPTTTAAAADAAGAAGGGYCVAIGAVASSAKSSSPSGFPSKAEVDALLGQMKAAQTAAPAALKPAFATAMDMFRELAKIGEDPASAAKVLALVQDPKVQKAFEDIQAHTKTACNLDLELAGGGAPSQPTAPTTLAAGAPTTAADPTSIDAVKAGVQAKAGSAAWVAAVIETGVWQYVAGGDTYDWEVQLSPGTTVTAEDAVAACKLIGEYLSPLQPGFTVTIKDADGKALVTRPRSAACAAT